MDFKNFKTGENDVNRRIDKVIRIFIKDLPLSSLYSAIRKGLIKVNNKKTKNDYRINSGDEIQIAKILFENLSDSTNSEKKQREVQSITLPPVVFKNDDLIIFNKPQFMAVHGNGTSSNKNNKKSLEEMVNIYYNQQEINDSLSFKPGPLHRIDKNTSGLIAFSWSIKGAQWFCENIKNHTIQKKYFGIVEGKLEKSEEWTDFISKNENQKNKAFHTVECKTENQNDDSKIAITKVKPVSYGKINLINLMTDENFNPSTKKTKASNTNQFVEVTLVEFDIKTGRQHQIRCQSVLHKHPLFGDTAYGGRKNPLSGNYYLHAAELIIPKDNPLNLPISIKAPIPDYFPIK